MAKGTEAKPFLKWAGGKGQLIDTLKKYFPKKLQEGKIRTYIEPFLGGGALFFYLIERFEFEEIILNDINKECILTYRIVQNNVDELISLLETMEDSYIGKDDLSRQEMFYNIRKTFNEEKKVIDYYSCSRECIRHAAHMIFLNRTCFNGLYRENSKGEYNVPMGKYKKPLICDSENLAAASKALKGVKLITEDFEELTDYADENTFIYMDPPYRPLSITSSFNEYYKEAFNDDSQKRLCEWYKTLSNDKKALLMLSNSDPTNTNPDDSFFDELYKGFNINRVSAIRAINSKSSGRGAVRELLITNY